MTYEEKLEQFVTEQIGQKATDLKLYQNAFVHRSFANESDMPPEENNERLEFLGDAVLGLVIGLELMKKYPLAPEGELSQYRSSIVNEKSLALASTRIGLGAFLKLGKGEQATGGREKSSILADCFESFIAAIYVSDGFSAASAFILKVLAPSIDDIDTVSWKDDYKSQLQELVQKKFNKIPRYKIVEQSGPDHDKTFVVAVKINSKIYGQGTAASKKKAEQESAKIALEALKREVA